MAITKTLRVDDYLYNQLEEMQGILKDVFGTEVSMNNLMCSLITKGAIKNLYDLSIIYDSNTIIENEDNRAKILKSKEKYESLLNNLEIYAYSIK